MARRRVDETPVEGAEEETVVEPVQVAPAPEPTPAPPPPAKSKPRPVFDGDPDEIHRKYFIPPAGYQKPKFPSSI